MGQGSNGSINLLEMPQIVGTTGVRMHYVFLLSSHFSSKVRLPRELLMHSANLGKKEESNVGVEKASDSYSSGTGSASEIRREFVLVVGRFVTILGWNEFFVVAWISDHIWH